MAINLSTESISRVSAKHPWPVIGLWVVSVLIAGFLFVSLLSDGETTEFVFVSDADPQVGLELLEDRLRGPTGTNEIVVIESESFTVEDPEFRQLVEDVTSALAGLGPEVIRPPTLANFYQTGATPEASPLVSADLSATIIPFVMAGGVDQATETIEDVVHTVAGFQDRDGFRVLLTGQAALSWDSRELGQEDLERGEIFGVPIALVVLVVVLGALAAAVIPLALAVASIAIALGVAALVGQVFEISYVMRNVVTMIGLAVGIDYSLFIVARYREERAKGLDTVEAISRAGATATRAVTFSGITVVLALLGMVLVPVNVFISIGIGAILAVVATMAASLTLLPAILGLFGDRINALTVPFIGKGQANYEPSRSGGFWDRLVNMVMRRPVVSLVLGVGLLAAMAIPFFGINLGASGVSTLPDRFDSKQGFLVLDEKFSFGEVTPAEVVIDGDINSPEVQDAIARLTNILAGDADFIQPRPLEVNDAGDLALLSVPVAGDATSRVSQDAVRRLSGQYVPEAFDGAPAQVYVTGRAAFISELAQVANDSVWVVFPFVLGMSFLLFIVVFRSVVLPVKAIILNLLAVGAAYGIVVLIFQEGWLAGALGFQQVSTIEAWLPLFLFTILYGLSMDYHVFLLSRIRERYDQTGDNVEAVAFGIRSTGRLITGAALIMVAVFWGFAAGDGVALQQLGFGLGIAILLDATIVRTVLVPASMRLLGKWNWYFPGWLEWIPDLRVEPVESPEPSSQAPALFTGDD